MGQSPFKVVQLLWINLILDTLAAIALSTEPPHATILTKHLPASSEEDIMSAIMWRQILGIAIYQVVAMIILMYFGRFMWDLDWSAKMAFDSEGNPTDVGVLYTILFNTFIYMQLFNFLNCRKIGEDEFNIFSRFFNNWLFIIILTSIIGCQYVIVQYGGRLFMTAPLTSQQHVGCLIWASLVLIVGALLKMTPRAWVNRIPVKIDERTASASDPLMNAYQKSKGSIKNDLPQKKVEPEAQMDGPVDE